MKCWGSKCKSFCYVIICLSSLALIPVINERKFIWVCWDKLWIGMLRLEGNDSIKCNFFERLISPWIFPITSLLLSTAVCSHPINSFLPHSSHPLTTVSPPPLDAPFFYLLLRGFPILWVSWVPHSSRLSSSSCSRRRRTPLWVMQRFRCCWLGKLKKRKRRPGATLFLVSNE